MMSRRVATKTHLKLLAALVPALVLSGPLAAHAGALDIVCPLLCVKTGKDQQKFGLLSIPFFSLISAESSQTDSSEDSEFSLLDATLLSIVEHESHVNQDSWRPSESRSTKIVKLPLLTLIEMESSTEPDVLGGSPEERSSFKILNLPIVNRPLFGIESDKDGPRINLLFLPGFGSGG